jgi:hypothetical protein
MNADSRAAKKEAERSATRFSAVAFADAGVGQVFYKLRITES